MLLSASCTILKPAFSTSRGRRSLGSGALRSISKSDDWRRRSMCQRRGGTNPRSSSTGGRRLTVTSRTTSMTCWIERMQLVTVSGGGLPRWMAWSPSRVAARAWPTSPWSSWAIRRASLSWTSTRRCEAQAKSDMPFAIRSSSSRQLVRSDSSVDCDSAIWRRSRSPSASASRRRNSWRRDRQTAITRRPWLRARATTSAPISSDSSHLPCPPFSPWLGASNASALMVWNRVQAKRRYLRRCRVGTRTAL